MRLCMRVWSRILPGENIFMYTVSVGKVIGWDYCMESFFHTYSKHVMYEIISITVLIKFFSWHSRLAWIVTIWITVFIEFLS